MNGAKKLLSIFMIFIISAQSLCALNVFGTPKNKEKVYVINMYGEDISLELIWRANSSLGGFDRTKEKILKKHHTTYQDYKAPFSEYHLYKIDVAPAANAAQGPIEMDNQFDNYISRYSNNETLEVERRDHYFVIEKSDEESQVRGQNKIAIREFASQKDSDAYLVKIKAEQDAYLKNAKIKQEKQRDFERAQQHLNALDPNFVQHYYGDSDEFAADGISAY